MTLTPTASAEPSAAAPGLLRRVLRNPMGLISAIVIVAFVGVALAAPLLAPFDPSATKPELTNASAGTGEYLLGGDSAGRDILSRLLWGARGTLVACVLVLSVSLVIGVTAGLFAGYYRGVVETVADWVADAILALPGVVLLIAMYAVIGPNILLAMAIYGALISPIFYRLVRGVVASIRTELYIDAAKVSGLGDLRILFRHVLRAVRSPIIIQSAFMLGTAVGIQAALEFLGLGNPGDPSWGGMLEVAFRNIFVSLNAVIWPAAAITLLVLAFVLLGNALRDGLEPASKKAVLKKRLRRELATARSESSEAERGEALLSVRGLKIGYPTSASDYREVVKGVDLEVQRQEILGLVGESGSGKSQTAFSILGVLPENAVLAGGSITFDGRGIFGREDELKKLRGRRISYIPQEPMTNLDPSLTIGKQLVLTLKAVQDISRSEAEKKFLSLLDQVGIPDPAAVMKKYPHEVSGGMAQRILIAGAIAAEPELIIADEPTTALDVTVQAEVLDLIRGLRDERGLSVILVTHDLGVVSDVCDRVAVMKQGQIVETADASTFLSGPEHEYSKSLLASASKLS